MKQNKQSIEEKIVELIPNATIDIKYIRKISGLLAKKLDYDKLMNIIKTKNIDKESKYAETLLFFNLIPYDNFAVDLGLWNCVKLIAENKDGVDLEEIQERLNYYFENGADVNAKFMVNGKYFGLMELAMQNQTPHKAVLVDQLLKNGVPLTNEATKNLNLHKSKDWDVIKVIMKNGATFTNGLELDMEKVELFNIIKSFYNNPWNAPLKLNSLINSEEEMMKMNLHLPSFCDYNNKKSAVFDIEVPSVEGIRRCQYALLYGLKKQARGLSKEERETLTPSINDLTKDFNQAIQKIEGLAKKATAETEQKESFANTILSNPRFK